MLKYKLKFDLKAAVLASIGGGVLLSNWVEAHARLTGSSPADGAQLAAAPSSMKLSFDESVKLTSLKLSAEGRTVPVSIDKTAQDSTAVTVALPALGTGRYTVEWTALSTDDGHVTKGSFSFVVGAASTRG